MKINNIFGLVVLVSFSLSAYSVEKMVEPTKRDRLFNTDWKFIRDTVKTAELEGYDDSKWITVNLPHDFSMMNLPGKDDSGQIGPFSIKSPASRDNGRVLGGTGWYRKIFTVDKPDAGKSFVLKFDGVYMETEVWINGKSAGIHKNGYSPFCFDITDLLNPIGEPNLIAVKVDNIGKNSRWYSGSGIYRNVHLVVTDPVHVSVWGVNVKTPEVKENSSVVDIAVTVQNDGSQTKEAAVKVNFVDPSGKTIHSTETTQKIEPGNNSIINKQITIVNPKLWSPDSPAQYTAKIIVSIDNKIVDQYIQIFGIRSIEFSAEKGFLLNGKSVKLKGGCIHHDNGLLGSAAFDRAEERRVEIMKANGFNAIRSSHNPPSESFLNACDRIGMLVMNEFFDVWEKPKKAVDYSKFFKESWKKDMTDVILRDRNHPGIIMWSIGNEIPERMDTSGLRIAKQLIEAVKELDTTRPVTEAVNIEYKGKPWDNTAPMFALLDIGGYNYEWKRMEIDHQKYPDRIIVGTESFVLEPFDNWKIVEKYPYVIGDFVWTAMDYLGEAGIGKSKYQPTKNIQIGNQGNEEGSFLMAGSASFNSPWPWFGANCGDIDITGDKKPQIAYRDVIWDNSLLEMNVHAPIPEGQSEIVSLWGWPDEWPIWNYQGFEGKPLQVRVFTKASHVKLELNGKVVGEKDLKIEDKYIAVFEVPYQSGELKAIAVEKGQEIASKILKTHGEPVAIRLTADRKQIKADRNDLSFVKVEVIDGNGQLVPQDSIKIKLILTGNGELVASGNASPIDMGSVNKPEINTFKGKAQAIIRSNNTHGKIILKAQSNGLKDGLIEIISK